MREKKLAELRAQTVAPASKEILPCWSLDEIRSKVTEEKLMLVIVNNFVHDVSAFAPTHPGGFALLNSYIGKDATQVFLGKTSPVVYKHSHAAENLLSNMRVAAVKQEEQEEQENKKEQ